MVTVFLILLILASAILGIIVLIQNPKGGGLAGNIAGFSNQFMGVKQTTDVLEKGTWLFAAIIAVLCITSSIFISGRAGGSSPIDNVTGPAPGSTNPQQNTAPFAPAPGTATPDTTRK
jgi:preprotein translocase subunit SecG